MDQTELENRATDMAGNWRKWDCFSWYAKPWDAENWCIYYTHNRDSDILSESNAAMIDKRMTQFVDSDNEDADVHPEHHNHWACGWIEGYAVRVYADNPEGNITPAFAEIASIMAELENYLVLDEEDYSQRECDAAWDAIADIAGVSPDDEDTINAIIEQVGDDGSGWECNPDEAWRHESEIREAAIALEEVQ